MAKRKRPPTMAKRKRPPVDPDAEGVNRNAMLGAQLVEDGYVVVEVLKPGKIDARRRQFLEALTNAQEFVVGEGPIQLGGFAATGCATAQHHEDMRDLRADMWDKALDVMPYPAAALGVNRAQMSIDRAMYRLPGQKVGEETHHRDITLQREGEFNGLGGRFMPKKGRKAGFRLLEENDAVFGTFLNLNKTEDQFISLCPKSHKGETMAKLQQKLLASKKRSGFSGVSDADRARYKDETVRVVVPAGCMVIFYAHIVHEVLQSSQDTPLHRLFMGIRLTNDTEPLVPDLRTGLRIFASIPLPSGQLVRMFSPNHHAFQDKPFKFCKERVGGKWVWRFIKGGLRGWSTRVLRPQDRRKDGLPLSAQPPPFKDVCDHDDKVQMFRPYTKTELTRLLEGEVLRTPSPCLPREKPVVPTGPDEARRRQ